MLQQFSPSAGRPHDDLDKYMDILLKVFKMFTKVYVVEKLVLQTIYVLKKKNFQFLSLKSAETISFILP